METQHWWVPSEWCICLLELLLLLHQSQGLPAAAQLNLQMPVHSHEALLRTISSVHESYCVGFEETSKLKPGRTVC